MGQYHHPKLAVMVLVRSLLIASAFAVLPLTLAFAPLARPRCSRAAIMAAPATAAENEAETCAPPHEVREVWLTPGGARGVIVGESVRQSEVVLCVPGIASASELGFLLGAGLAAREGERKVTNNKSPAHGRHRFSCSDPILDQSVVERCEEILLRVLDRLDEDVPSVYETLFKPSDGWASRQPKAARPRLSNELPEPYLEDACPSLRELYMAGELEWSEGEPAINVYQVEGHFGAHCDHMALSILIPLSCPTLDFSGGGTGFWSPRDSLDADGASPDTAPTALLRPSLGTAIVFGGDLAHAGMPVEAGTRSVLVASFSTRTPASPADRTYGLQAAPSSGNLRGYY